MKKNLLLVFISIFITFLLIYFLLFIKTFLEKNHKSEYLFKSRLSLEFHEKYSNILNHLRNSNQDWDFDGNQNNFLFSIINDLNKSNKNVLWQGDSWIEQINLENASLKSIIQYSKKNNFGMINAGITSFSPTLMKLQYEILKSNFDINPNIVIAYIDQTDIGDEICRYKNKRYFNSEKKLIGVHREKFSRSIYDYSKIYKLSEINLSKKSKLMKNFHFTNFYIEFKIKRAAVKIKNLLISGLKNKDENRCYFGEIQKYLKKNLNNTNRLYFQNRLADYFKTILNDNQIEKIIIVTFPHRNNLFQEDDKNYYKENVSNLVDKELRNIDDVRIKHLNFYKILKDSPKFSFDIYREGDPASHLNETPHNEIFIKEILKNIK